MLGQQNKVEVRCMYVTQWLVSAVIVLLMLMFVSRAAALSVFYGATVSLLPSALFGIMVFRHQGAQKLKKILSSVYLGEGLKLLLAAGLFGMYLETCRPIWPLFFAGFLCVHASFCLAPLFCKP